MKKNYLKCFLAFIFIAGFSIPAKAQFKFYIWPKVSGAPSSVLPFAINYSLIYNAAVPNASGQNANTCKPNIPGIQAAANNNLSSPSTPVNFDVELNSPPAYNTTAFTDSLNNYIQIVNDFKAINTTSKVGFYAVPPQQEYGNYANVNSSFAPTANAMKPLANAVDYYSPDFYNYGSNDTVNWRKYVDTTLAVIKKYYGTSKPVYPYISPNPSGTPTNIDTAVWLYDLNYMYTHTQGALIWLNGGGPAWDNNAPWWRVTKRFMIKKGLAPPLVFDTFTVFVSGHSANLQWATSADTTSQYFVVQRSTDNVNYTNVSGHIAQSGYAYNYNKYQFTDTTLSIVLGRTVYYRIVATDHSNNISYSNAITYLLDNYRSNGTVDFNTATNWQALQNGSWVAATSSPNSSIVAGDTVTIRSTDTLKISSAYVVSGSVILDNGITGTPFKPYFSSGSTFEFNGTSAQTFPGNTSISSPYWGNIIMNNSAGVKITQSADNFVHMYGLNLQSGTLTINADGGHAAALYLDGHVNGSGGHIAVTTTGSNQGVIVGGGSTAQSLPSGAFLNNTISTLTLNNAAGVSYGSSLTVNNTTHLMRQATFTIGGNYSVDSLTVDTLGSGTPVTVSGTATLSGELTVKNFVTTPTSGQQYTIISATSLSGAFAPNAVLPSLPSGYTGVVTNSGNKVILTIVYPQLVSGAVYKITSSINNSSNADLAGLGSTSANSTAVQLHKDSINTSQLWKAVSIGGGYYKFESMLDTTKVLDVTGAATTNGTQVDIYTTNGTNAQKWLPTNLGSNYFTLSPACAPGSVLDDSNASVANGNKIDIWTANSTSAQKWLFQLVNSPAVTDSLLTIADAYVKNISPTTTNYGAASYLVAENNYYETYLKFNISSITAPLTSAKVRLYSLNGVTTTLQLYKVNASGNGWTESGISWANKPAADTLLTSINLTPSNLDGYIYFDITSQLNALRANAGGVISVKIVSTTGTYEGFSSKEGSTVAQRPYLMLNRATPVAVDTAADIADTFADEFNPTTNYGANSYMAAENGAHNCYVKFNLHGIKKNVQGAKLRLYATSAVATQWQVYKVNNNSWTESGLNWNNQPGGNTLLGTITAPSTANNFVYWDITPQLQSIGADSTLSLEIVSTATNYSSFATRQSIVPAYVPVIVYTAPSFSTDLSVAATHTGAFYAGETSQQLNITVTNHGSNTTSSSTTVTDVLPEGFTYVSSSGTGWTTTVSGQTVTSTNSGVVLSGQSFPALTITVNIASNAAASLNNTVTVKNINDGYASNNSSTDNIIIYRLLPGIVGNSQTIVSGATPASLIQTAAPSGSSDGNYIYQWQSADDDVTFSNISGATGATYSPGSLTATTYYRLLVNATARNLSALPTDTISITISGEPAFKTSVLALSNFTGNHLGNVNLLKWTTSAEINTKGFDVLKSTDNGSSWKVLNFVAANSTSGDGNYQYADIDGQLFKFSLYKLRRVDLSDNQSESNIISVSDVDNTQTGLYPNPATSVINIKGASGMIGVYDIFGKKVIQQRAVGEGDTSIAISNLKPGLYITQTENGIRYTFIKK